jgi:putative endonuclease
MFYVYILKSVKNGSYYVGTTRNISNRLKEHNSGETKSTRYLAPYEVIYSEPYGSLCDARRRERYIKSRKSKKYIEKLISRGVAQLV